MRGKSKWCFNDLLRKHIKVVAFFLVYLLLLASGLKVNWTMAIMSSTYTLLVVILLSLLTRYVLIKYYLEHRKTFLYYLFSFLLISLFINISVNTEIQIFKYLSTINNEYFPEPGNVEETKMIFPFFRMTIILLITFAVTTITYLQDKEKESSLEREELTSEKLAMELRYLKSQINPHFLFNALNNIYSMVYTNDENAAESILKLSEMLRYVTVDCQADSVPIGKEVKYIENYIDFQMMLMESSPNISFEKEIQNPDFKFVPMIFQPFVENSFKYSRLKNDKSGFIHISIKQESKELVFFAENSVVQSIIPTKEEQSRIGVANVKKRLELVYGKNFDLDVENNSQFYRVILKIKGCPFDFKKDVNKWQWTNTMF